MTTASQLFNADGTFTAPSTLLNGTVGLAVHGAGSLSGINTPGALVQGNLALAASGTLSVYVGDYHHGGAAGLNGHAGYGSSAVVKSGTLEIEAGGAGGNGGGGFGIGGDGGQPGGTGSTAGGAGGTGGNSATPGSGGAGTGGGGNGANGTAGGAAGTTNGGAGGTGSVDGGGGGGGGYAGGGGGGGTNTGGGSSFGGGGGGGSSYYSPAISVGSTPIVTGGSTYAGGAVIVTYTYADPPLAPTLTSPANAVTMDTNASGVTFAFTPNNGTDSGPLNAYALRIKTSGGAYQYWNAGTVVLQAGIVWNAVAPTVRIVVIPAGILADGVTYTWSIATQENHYNLQGPFASDLTIIAVAAPTLTLTGPSSPSGTTQPTVSWSETLTAPPQTNYQVLIFTDAQHTAGIIPGVTTPYYDSGVVSSAATSFAVPSGALLFNGVTYWAYVRITETGGVQSAWASTSFAVAFGSPNPPALTASPTTDPATGMPVVQLFATEQDNLLSANDASFEATIGTWIAITNASGTGSMARSATWAQDGSDSLKVASTAAGDMIAGTATGTAGYAVTPLATYTAMASFHAATVGRVTAVAINWYKASGASSSIKAQSLSFNNNDNTTGVVTDSITDTAPSDAAFAQVRAYWYATGAANEAHYTDEVGLFPGTVATWGGGGYVGQPTTKVEIQYSDDGGATWADVRNGSALAYVNQQASVIDYEGPLTQSRLYRARTLGVYNSQPVSSIWSSSVSAQPPTATPIQWWLFDPLNTDGAVAIFRAAFVSASIATGGQASLQVDKNETQGEFLGFGNPDYIIVHGDMHNEEFDLVMVFLGDTAWTAFDALRDTQTTVCIRDDMGNVFYMDLGPARPRVIIRGDRLDPAGPYSQVTCHCYPTGMP